MERDGMSNGGKEQSSVTTTITTLTLQPITSEDQLKQLCMTGQGWEPAIIGFGATWSEPCVHVKELLETLASGAVENSHKFPVFGFCDIDQGTSLVKAWGIDSIPSVVFLRDGDIVQVLQGADPPTITRACRDFIQDCHLSLDERLEKLVHQQPIMLFMKGTPDKPFCKFSKRMVEILQREGITFGYFNILADFQVRQGLKQYSHWPTYPQLYVHGELIGGLDIVEEIYRSGKWKDVLRLS